MLFIVFNIKSQLFLTQNITDVERQHTLQYKGDLTYVVVNTTKVILQIREDGMVISEAYNINVEQDYINVLKLLNSHYERDILLDDVQLGEAFLHKEYRVLCYKKNFAFIFTLYNQ